ncbi:uncharacterized protein [Ambystoma mexicanum]|uniref:uncharacterized protein n=1 Tax=Ambystoma mexicanum TaxID=8296 RepID=UPI0037E8B613
MTSGNRKKRGPYGKELRTTFIDVNQSTSCANDFEPNSKRTRITESATTEESHSCKIQPSSCEEAIGTFSSCSDSESFTSQLNSDDGGISSNYEGHCTPEDFVAIPATGIDVDDELFEKVLMESKLRNCDVLVDDCEDDNLFSEQGEILDDIDFPEGETTEIDGIPQEIPPGTEHIHSGTTTSLGAAVLMICCLLIKFKLPDEAISDILTVIGMLLPQGHCMIKSLYHLRLFFKDLANNLIPTVHYYCSSCYTPVKKSTQQCTSHVCGKNLTEPGAMSYFVQLSIIAQLQSLWKRNDFSDYVRTHRFKHYSENIGNISDIYDGLLYKEMYKKGILSDKNNLSFSMNTDGVPIFKSSNVSMWPVYMLINELPIAMRKKRHNILLYGIWISPGKPPMWSFLQPLYEELALLEKGYEFHDENGPFVSRCALLTCTCDLPARALVYNCVQFNGYYSCWHCLQKGKRYKFQNGGSSHIFPYDENDPKGNQTMRTKTTMSIDIESAIGKIQTGDANHVVRGHKGPFWFLYLQYTDARNSCVIDYMHGVCLGVMNLLLRNWFSKENKDNYFSFFDKKEYVSNALKKIKPTLFVTRVPRTIEDLVHWKASEFRNFLLYWGVPILKKVLTESYFVHFCLLSRGIYQLSKESISEQDLSDAERCLITFVELYEQLYGERGMTLNLHNLIHLTDCVRFTGPLYINNCFIFEDLNGFLLKNIHAKQGVDMQILHVIGLWKVTPLLFEVHKKQLSDEVIDLYHSAINCTRLPDKSKEIDMGICALGKIVWKQLPEEHYKLLQNMYGLKETTVKCFLRVNMYKRGFYVYGSEYCRLKKRQQSAVSYRKGNQLALGIAVCFLQFGVDSAIYNVALIENFKMIGSIGQLWTVEKGDLVDAVPMSAITNACNLVQVESETYIIAPPNRYDLD